MTRPSADVLSWLERLIGFDTTSSRSNLPLIAAVADDLRALGLEPLVLPREDQTKANLVVTVPDRSGNLVGGVMLSGHTDVVPTEGQSWASDPYRMVERDGLIHGRGVTDMKGFVAVALAAVPAMVSADLREPIHLALSYDEEVGCLGAGPLVAALRRENRLPDTCFVGEPTSMRMIRGHKSITVATVEVTGRAAHSSLSTSGVNAIEHAATIVNYWRERKEHWRTEGPFDAAYPLPYTTGAVTTVTGGNGVNIIPASCRLTLEFRAVGAADPGRELAALAQVCCDVEQAMRTEAGDAADQVGVRLTVDAETPGLDTPADDPVVTLGASLGLTPLTDKVTYGTEAGIFSAAGVSTVVCGPGDIAQAHTPDEFIEPAQLVACEAFVARLVEQQRG
ncbi:MAG: acetylornithine deacetylase [Propioniciclava sp.]